MASKKGRNKTVKALDKSVGPCKICGNAEWWWNNMPIEGTCGGPEDARHDEVTAHPPLKAQIYATNMTEREQRRYEKALAGRQFVTRMVTKELK
jgi:hypothetical protein